MSVESIAIQCLLSSSAAVSYEEETVAEKRVSGQWDIATWRDWKLRLIWLLALISI
jgi:hypothetical protein